jgi:hypothetical protein
LQLAAAGSTYQAQRRAIFWAGKVSIERLFPALLLHKGAYMAAEGSLLHTTMRHDGAKRERAGLLFVAVDSRHMLLPRPELVLAKATSEDLLLIRDLIGAQHVTSNFYENLLVMSQDQVALQPPREYPTMAFAVVTRGTHSATKLNDSPHRRAK